MKQVKSYRFKIIPTKEQETLLDSWLGVCRYMYNIALEYKIMLWRDYKLSVSGYDIIYQLPSIRKEYSWVNSVPSETLQGVIERTESAYSNYFRGGGFPKFAKKSKFNSLKFKQCIKTKNNKVKLSKLGWIKYKNSQEVVGKIKTATVKKYADGWYVGLVCEVDIESLPILDNSIGIDFGIKDFVTLSNGAKVGNPKHLEKYEHKLRKLNRDVSRKKLGSSNREKAKKKLALCHLKIKNTRKDYQHKLSTKLIRENQTIVVENLKVSKMVMDTKFSKSISDVGWSQFTNMLEYKSKWYGRTFIKVNPAYTSQDCSSCGHRNEQLTLKVREWICPKCNTVHDRDINAAKNILNKHMVGQTTKALELYIPIGEVA